MRRGKNRNATAGNVICKSPAAADRTCSPHATARANRADINSRNSSLTLGELRRLTGFVQTVFLALFLTRVATEESRFLKGRAIGLFVAHAECAGNAVTDCAGLSGQ